MRKGFKDRKVWAAVLACVLLISLLAVPGVYGADGIDTGRPCGVTFKLDGQYAELESLTIPVSLYRVASVGVDGRYTALNGFTGLDFSSVNSGTTAEQWAQMAEQASQIVETTGAAAAAPPAQIRQGTAQVGGLETGMYLVEAGFVQTERYTYDFIPYLLALPGNYYYRGESDDWVYDMETVLKQEQQPRYGSLRIEKILDNYNVTLSQRVGFSFAVEEVGDGKDRYSDVVSVFFDGAGTEAVTIDGLPAGIQVTVKEIDYGVSSGYQIVGGNEQTVSITADSTVPVSFRNTYSGSPNSGSSIVNHYTYRGDGVWNDPVQITDGAQNGQE